MKHGHSSSEDLLAKAKSSPASKNMNASAFNDDSVFNGKSLLLIVQVPNEWNQIHKQSCL